MTVAVLDENNIATTAGEITVYNYSDDDKLFINLSVEYLAIGVGIPANSTLIAPPDYSEKQIPVFNDEWSIVPDHRGETVYSTETGAAVEMAEVGDYPKNTTTLRPATIYDKWDGTIWVTDTNAQHAADVAEAERQKTELLEEATAIIAPLADAQAGGYIDDADVPRLAEWQRYRYKLTKVDTSTAPDISWPQHPEEEAIQVYLD